MNLRRRVEEVKIATADWKSNLTNLSVAQSGLSIDLADELRGRVTKVAEDVKKFDNDMKAFVRQMYDLQDMAKTYEREMGSLELSVRDTSRVCIFIINFP